MIRRRRRQRGSAMLVTLLIIVALLAGASVLVGLQLASTKSADLTRSGMSALYCAEAGLAAARPVVLANYSQWGSALSASSGGTYTEPAWISSGIDAAVGSHDVDGSAPTDDFSIYLEDNADELTSNPAADQDLRVYIVSTCNRYPDTPKQVRELVEYNGVAPCYPWQVGGCGGDGNEN